MDDFERGAKAMRQKIEREFRKRSWNSAGDFARNVQLTHEEILKAKGERPNAD